MSYTTSSGARRCSGLARRPHGVPFESPRGVGGVIVLANLRIEDWLVRVGLRLGVLGVELRARLL
eukprot:10269270-Lingulodinium_polyedra.AAC.1